MNQNKGHFLKFFWLLPLLFPIIFVQGVSIPRAFTPEDAIFDVGDLGKIRGVAMTTDASQREFMAFYGIPYGNYTSEDNRFVPADDITIPLAGPDEIFEAAGQSMYCCPQYESILCMGQNENCLQLAVATPLIQSNMATPLPVIFFIHGGAFTSGSFAIYNGGRLLERDVVLVSINYRLGVLGFFCLNTEEAPGNAAMYDVIQALKWVKKYIHHFGGDPNSITIAGQSAGSVAVTQLMLSPMSQADDVSFHRAIAMSGTALNEWGTTTAEKAEEASLDVAARAGCYDPLLPYNSSGVVDCMKFLDPTALISALGQYQSAERLAGRLGFAAVSPVIQKAKPWTQPIFLEEKPVTILEEGRQMDVPMMMGSTRHDGSYVLAVVYNEVLHPQGLEHNATFLKTMAMPMLMAALGIEDNTGAIYDLLADAYLGSDIKMSGNFSLMIPGMIDLHSVFFFKAAELKTLNLHSRLREKNSYWYSFDYQGLQSLYSMQVGNIPVPGGVSHADDLLYLFNIPLFGHALEEEKAVSKRLINFWVNFATNGDPNIGEPSGGEDWPNYTEDSPGFLVHDADFQVIHDLPSNHWRGLSYELMPELFPPFVDTTTTTENVPPTSTDSATTTENVPPGGTTEATTESGANLIETNLLFLGLAVLGGVYSRCVGGF